MILKIFILNFLFIKEKSITGLKTKYEAAL